MSRKVKRYWKNPKGTAYDKPKDMYYTIHGNKKNYDEDEDSEWEDEDSEWEDE